MPRTYYGLFIYDNGRWEMSFGDTDKEAVEFEYEDFRDHGWSKKDLALVSWHHTPKQVEVDATAERLNMRTKK